jgi:hypothetical protein
VRCQAQASDRAAFDVGPFDSHPTMPYGSPVWQRIIVVSRQKMSGLAERVGKQSAV